MIVASLGSLGLTDFFAVDLLHTVRQCAGPDLNYSFRQLEGQTRIYERCPHLIDGMALLEQVFATLDPPELMGLLKLAQGDSFTLLQYVVFRKLPGDHPLRGHHRHLLQRAFLPQSRVDWVLGFARSMPDLDPSAEDRQAFAKTHVVPPDDCNFYRKSNPLTSGNLVLDMIKYQASAHARYAVLQHEVFAMCHLYNALLQLRILTDPWPMLDRIIDLHLKPLFLGVCPSTAKDALSRFMLAHGYSGSAVNMLMRDNLNGYRASSFKVFAAVDILKTYLQTSSEDGSSVVNPGGEH